MQRENTSINCKYIGHTDNSLIYKCKKYNNRSQKLIDALKEKFLSTYPFCYKDNDKFILLLRKGVYPYEYMDANKVWNSFDIKKLK